MTPEQIQNKPFFYKPFYIPPKADIFAQRAARFQELAQQDPSSWHDYLTIMANLAQAQQHALDQYPRQPENKRSEFQRSQNEQNEFQRNQNERSKLQPTLPPHTISSLHTIIHHIAPTLAPSIQATLTTLLQLPEAELTALATRVLQGTAPEQEKPYQIWLHAALQVAYTAQAQQQSDDTIPPQDDRAHCPHCGSEAIASIILSGGDWDGLRYQHCALCNSQWNALRAKCTYCNDQSAISHQQIDDPAAPPVYQGARAECCGQCHHYRKVFLHSQQRHADPIADDLASLALDILVAEQNEYTRGGHNPFWLED